MSGWIYVLAVVGGFTVFGVIFGAIATVLEMQDDLCARREEYKKISDELYTLRCEINSLKAKDDDENVR